MTDLLLVLLINFFALYTTSQYLAGLKKEEQKKLGAAFCRISFYGVC